RCTGPRRGDGPAGAGGPRRPQPVDRSRPGRRGMGERMSDRDLRASEQDYVDDARRWLRAYPPRWRRLLEEEVLGVLLDTRPPAASRLDLRTRLDLLRGGLLHRLRSRPPFLQWLMWRWFDLVPAPA